MRNGEHPGPPPKARGPEWQDWYQRYLRSWAWEEKRQLVLERADCRCEGCGENRATEVHHSTYKNVGYEFLFELIAICSECHARYHGRKPRSPVEPAPDRYEAGPDWLEEGMPSPGTLLVMTAAPRAYKSRDLLWFGPNGMKVCDALEAATGPLGVSVPWLVRTTGLSAEVVIGTLKVLKDLGTVQRSTAPSGGVEIWSLKP